MTIIFSKKITPASVTKIKESEAFIAFITENFVKDERCLAECRMAQEANKPMYAVIKDKNAWNKIKNQFQWRKTLRFQDETPDTVVKKIRQDLDFIRAIEHA